MRRGLLFVIGLFVFSFFVSAGNALAQDAPKVEVGAQYAFFRSDKGIGSGNANGVGALLVANFSDFVGADIAVFHFPDQDIFGFTGVNATQGFFGIKSGMRSEKAGIFAKLRPGFVKFTGGGSSDTNFAMDIGGVLEFYPSRNVAFRFDLGDTIIRLPVLPSGSINANNLQFSAGVMFRF